MSPGNIKAIAAVVLVVIIVGITIPGTEACSGGSEIITHEYHNTTDCISPNAHVNSLRGTTTKNVTGWNLDNIEYGSVTNEDFGSCRDGNSWWGYKTHASRYSVGSINTTLSGCGMAKLDFGECNGEFGHSTNVNLNGIEIGVATSGQLSNTIDVNFKDGDILELKQKNFGSLIRFNSFTVIICC